jgi:predicted GNAT family N-acyltransferase
MATHPDVRGRGFGGIVLAALLDHVAVQGGGLVWCNARVAARNLYARAGFTARGAVFDIPGIGPHLQMGRIVPDHLPPADTRSLTDGGGSGEAPAD